MGRAHGVAARTLKHSQITEPLSLRSLRSCNRNISINEFKRQPIAEARRTDGVISLNRWWASAPQEPGGELRFSEQVNSSAQAERHWTKGVTRAHVGTGADDRRGGARDDRGGGGGGGRGGRRLCGGAAAAFTPALTYSAAAVAARVAPAPIARPVAAVHAQFTSSFARWPRPQG